MLSSATSKCNKSRTNRNSDSLISRTSNHSGAVKALQFNPKHSNLLASGGAKGELFISDVNNLESPSRLGNNAARTDDIECLDWNKKVAHIMATGSSAGFITVWDVKTKKESLTLNNVGRKAVSSVAWDPEKVGNRQLSWTGVYAYSAYTAHEVDHIDTCRIGSIDLRLGPAKLACSRKSMKPEPMLFYNQNIY